MKKVAILFVLFTGMVLTGKTQFYIGGNLNYNLYLGGTGLKSLGLGLTGEWSPDQDVSLTRIGFSYGLPATDEQIFTVQAIDPFITSPEYLDVTGKSKIGFMHFTFDYKRFLGDADYEDGGFYAYGGVGLSIAKVSYTIGSYDTSKYRLTYAYEPESYFQACLRLGIGYDVNLDFGNIYGEVYTNIPANNVSGVYVAVSIPMSVGLQAGIRIPIGG